MPPKASAVKAARKTSAVKKTARSKSPAKRTALENSIDSGEIPWAVATRAKRGAIRSRATHSLELPINESNARKATRWLMAHFGNQIAAAAKGTPFGPEILCAIVCQETAYFWLPLLESLERKPEYNDDPDELADLIVARCVLDASGDHPASPRSAFPKNTAAFRDKYGPEFTNMLISEANKTRALRNYGPKDWVYKGYGIFQYDLQSVVEDEDFFRERKWYDFSACLAHCVGELKSKYKTQGNDLWEAVRAYNGAGPHARSYRDNVKQFTVWTGDEISKLPPRAVVVSPATRSSRGGKLPDSKPQHTTIARPR